ncbi:hypothetical protein OG936_33525 [Streptomyces sp. NBC_00846]|uniref:hypothetical protein n=1 Tax=Streptomyces sp. NBC_00846 TaxID=2975849 RepID=UPI00387011B7|nr:hypothetical protein OG936_33525 [Streptomyces sp. NBC_00846]
MLAEEFGYQVSSQPAQTMTPDLRQEMDTAIESRKEQAEEQEGKGNNYGFGVFFAFVFVGFLVSDWDITPMLIFVGGFLGLGIAGLVPAHAKAVVGQLQTAKAAALSAPWQTWPCRVEGTIEGGGRLLLLLAPDGTTARAFRALLPDSVWMGMTDGRGLVWFVGDMRFGGFMSLPGGDPIWPVVPYEVKTEPTRSSSGMHLVEEELTRQAVAFSFDEWLT